MPDVRGLEQERAFHVLADAGVRREDVAAETRSATGLRGVVVSQRPAFGAVDPGCPAIVVSQEATMPDAVGRPGEEVTTELEPPLVPRAPTPDGRLALAEDVTRTDEGAEVVTDHFLVLDGYLAGRATRPGQSGLEMLFSAIARGRPPHVRTSKRCVTRDTRSAATMGRKSCGAWGATMRAVRC